MSNIPIWPGSSSFFPGMTPFAFYDNDYQFQTDADKVAKFVTQRLGYPIQEVELQDINIYTAFEESITTYGNELYAYKLRDNYLSLEGLTTGSNINNAIITPNMNGIIRLSQQYASEAGVGGNITYFSGSLALTESIQDYDLTEWAISQSITGGIEIKRIFYEAPPAMSSYYNPYAGLGAAPAVMNGGIGIGYGINFLLTPVSYDLQLMQQVEFTNQIRRAQYTFELINNKLKIFPIPNGTVDNLIFQYIKLDDRTNNSILQAPTKVNNIGNVPYVNPTYAGINSIGRQWIFEYTLSICKEMLGYVRGKYGTIPIPGNNITLNQSDLLSDAKTEKESLITNLRAYFDSTSRQALLERRNQENLSNQSNMTSTPMLIYIG